MDKYPKSIFCIIATEFCERFSFCGLRTILSLYLRNELLVPENTSTIVYHVFIMLCYLGPLVGAALADGFLGRYRTILYFSFVYLIGNILMCFAATPPLELPPLSSTILGLVLIALGTGGIKPCVAAFGGDQFRLPEQQVRLQAFFSMFYFAINTGGLAGMLATPALRKAVTCFGGDTCYSLGFGFPAVLMLLALCVFVLGKPWYRIKKPQENVLLKFLTCTMFAAMNKLNTPKHNRTKAHWLDYAEGRCDRKLIEDMKIMYAILFLYVPLPLFWSLFDQQGSRWTFQASRTNGTVSLCGLQLQVLPDQMQVVNPAIVLLLIPLFERAVYPYCEPLRTPLRRMVAGGVAAGAAFLASGLLELELQKTYPELPDPGTAAVNIINTLACPVQVLVHSAAAPGGPRHAAPVLFPPHELHTFRNVTVPVAAARNTSASTAPTYSCEVVAPEICDGVKLQATTHTVAVSVQDMQVDTILIGLKDEGSVFLYVTDPVDFSKSLNGKPRMRLAYMHGANDIRNVTVTLKSADNSSGLQDVYFVADAPQDFFSLSPYMELPPGRYEYTVQSTFDFIHADGSVLLELGGVYTLVIREFKGSIDFTGLYTMTLPNTVHMFWLLPQYFLISVGEIMFAISGLEFSFTQAPKSMKTIIIAAWYLTVALGNFLVILITQARIFRKQSHEFFMFAVLIFIDMAVFSWTCIGYKPVPLEADYSRVRLTSGEASLVLTERLHSEGKSTKEESEADPLLKNERD